MSAQPVKPSNRSSLAKRFNLSLVVMYVLTVLITTPLVYFSTKQQVYNRAEQDLNLLVDVVKSIQKFVATDLRPHFMKEQIFYSPAFSGIVATSRIAHFLRQQQPSYYISNVSDNPLNPDNMASGLELDILNQFRNDRALGVLNTIGEINGQAYLVSSAPKVSKKGCLRCHGDPELAPQDIKDKYVGDAGFGYRTGEVVGVSLVGVPIEDVQALAINRSLKLIGAITVLFTILFLVLNILVHRLILVPINEITSVAIAVSRGEITREVHVNDRRDEIAALAKAFELMRRSLITAMKRLKRDS